MKTILNFLFLVIFLIFPLGQLVSFYPDIPYIPKWVRIHPLDWVVGGLVITWVVWQLVARKKIKAPPGAKLILFFITIAFLSWVVNLKNYTQLEAGVAILYLVRWVVYSGIYFVVYNLNTQWLNGYMVKWLLAASALSAIFGLLQYAFFPDMRALEAAHWDPHYYRVVGTFLDPGFTGMIYVLTLILLVSQISVNFFNSSDPGSKKVSDPGSNIILSGFAFIILYAALALTYSRASYLAFFVAMALIAYFKKSWRFFAFITLLLALTILILPQPGGEGVKLRRTSTIQARIEDYQHALQIIKDHPLFGVGFNFYRYAQRDYGFLEEDWQESHAGAGSSSSFLFVFATTGLFGIATYLVLHTYLIYKILLKIRRFAANSSKSSDPGSENSFDPGSNNKGATLSSAIALIVHSFFNNSLFYPWIMLWMWIILGSALKKEEVI